MDKDAVRRLPARAIVAAIGDAAERWSDADFPVRVRATAAIAARLEYTIPTVDYALDRLFGGLTRGALTAAIADELGAVEALDGLVERAGRPASWARGVDRTTIVSSDTTIGVAIAPLAFALCAKSAVTVKDRSDALVAAFVETLAEERPELLAATSVGAWSGGADARDETALGEADVVVAFGGNEALRAIRARLAPGATFVPFGHRASAGYVARDVPDADVAGIAARIARDALLYDGDGCLSLHVLFVERMPPGPMDRFVRALADACTATMLEFPPGRRDPVRAATVASYAAAAAFRAANGTGSLIAAPDGAWTIAVDSPASDVPPFGGGIIPIVIVDGQDDAAAYVRAHRLPLQAIGVGGPGIDRARLAVGLGAVRVTELGGMQDPPIAGHHGGRARIADFVRWIDRE